MKMFGSRVVPDLLETMNKVRARSMRLSMARICCGSVESRTCSRGNPAAAPNVLASTSGPIKTWGGYVLSWGSQEDHGPFHQNYDFNDQLNSLFGKLTFSPDPKSQGFVAFNNTMAPWTDVFVVCTGSC